MKNKKILAEIILASAMGIVLLGVGLAIWLHREDKYTTLEEMAYDQSGRKTIVYIKESNEYIPYLVLESDYGGNVLSEEMQYKPSKHEHGDGRGALSGGWAWYEYGSYYEESSIDEFLNTDFLKVFSPNMQAAIMDTTIEVTDMESYDEERWAKATHMIDRKVFLLSAVELGITFSVGNCITKEGTPLQYFENTKHSVKKAYTADGTAWPYWTRTPWIYETYDVSVIGATYELACATPDRWLGVRPAFCMAKDTAVQKKSGIIERKSVYVLDLEGE